MHQYQTIRIQIDTHLGDIQLEVDEKVRDRD